MIHAGMMRERVLLQKPATNRTGLGSANLEWEDVAEVWASVNGVTAREFLLAGQQQTNISHRVQMRYLTGLTHQMRILWRGRTFEIVSILERENRSQHELLCQETV